MYQAASSGLGLARGFNPLIDPFLNDGRLRIIGEQRHRMAGAYYVATTRRALQQKAVRPL